MANSICFIDNYPEESSPVINETNVQFNGANAAWYEERFELADLTSGTTFSLAHYPASAGTIALFLNSGAQRQGVDYTVTGDIIVMAAAIVAGDVIMVKYFAFEAETEAGNVPLGTILWQVPAVAPVGYCLADGVASYTIADYPALYAYATTNSLILSETATAFVLKDLGMTVNAIVLKAIIKN